jgi:hypothetical protein
VIRESGKRIANKGFSTREAGVSGPLGWVRRRGYGLVKEDGGSAGVMDDRDSEI